MAGLAHGPLSERDKHRARVAERRAPARVRGQASPGPEATPPAAEAAAGWGALRSAPWPSPAGLPAPAGHAGTHKPAGDRRARGPAGAPPPAEEAAGARPSPAPVAKVKSDGNPKTSVNTHVSVTRGHDEAAAVGRDCPPRVTAPGWAAQRPATPWRPGRTILLVFPCSLIVFLSSFLL